MYYITRMKVYAIATASLLISTMMVAQNRSIEFNHDDFNALKQKAQAENKLIFVDAFTVWCGPCKYMAKNIFTNDTVADFYNKHFINAKIDMEKGEGIELAKKYQVMCYPNLLFIDGKGNLVHRTAGSMTAKEFISLGEMALKPAERFSYYKENYEAKKGNAGFLKKYIEMKSGTCLEPEKEVEAYFALQEDKHLIDKENWEMIRDYSNNLHSREFRYLIANREQFEKAYTTETVNQKIESACAASLNTIIRAKTFDKAAYDKIKKEIEEMKLPYQDKIFFDADLKLAKKNSDWKTYAKLAVNGVNRFYEKDADALNSFAWTFYEHVDDQEAMLRAESWAKLSVSLEPGYANNDTYAWVLYKNGKKEQAKRTAKEAIELAQKDNYGPEDYAETKKLIQRIDEESK